MGQILTQCLNNPESKFLDRANILCALDARSLMQRAQRINWQRASYCVKEVRRKLEHRDRSDHEVITSAELYSNVR